MNAFTTFVFTPAGLGHADLAIAASRAGAVGIYNAEFDDGTAAARQALGKEWGQVLQCGKEWGQGKNGVRSCNAIR